MSIFAEIKSGVVSNVAVAEAAANLPPGTWVQIDTLTPQPGIGWAYSGTAFAPPSQPAPTLSQQAMRLLATGLTITSSSTPALDGVYSASATVQQQINAEVTSILLNNTFTDGTNSIEWLDTTGSPHTFTIAQFKTLATAIAAFVSGCVKVMNSRATVLPAATVTIA